MSSDVSAVLQLPFILPAQAQKHVTHNEAIAALDLLVQAVVKSRHLAAPPLTPAQGDRYIVPAAATGDFAGHTGRIALWDMGQWQFLAATAGWRVEVLDESTSVVFDGSLWKGPAEMVQRVAGLGIATDADGVNRLAVASPATLLTHAGAGHQLKVNKALASDTASLLFQTGWSGRAEMGTAGSNDFSIKTSADGSAFHTALRAVAGTGGVELPSGVSVASGTAALPGLSFVAAANAGLFAPAAGQIGLAAGGVQRALLSATGLTLDVPLSGSAVTQSARDTTAGRVTKVGDYGWPYAVVLGATDNLDAIATSGAYFNPTGANAAGNNYPLASAGSLLHLQDNNAGRGTQTFIAYSTANTYVRSKGASGVWSAWRRLDAERGSNANGDYVRLPDGTQLCWLRRVQTALALGTAFHGGFRAAYDTWTFPAAFSAAPEVSATALLGSAFGAVANSPTTTSVGFSAISVTSSAAADRTTSLIATGRWF